jgi:hypothetical protein
MLEAIALKLITTLTGFLFEGYLDTFKYNEINGAPTWYGSSGSSDVLVGYGYAQGGMESIKIAQKNCRMDIRRKIDKSIEVIIYDNFKHVKKPKEKEFLKRFKNDSELGTFVTKHLKYEKVEHLMPQEKTLFQDTRVREETFAGCIIPKQAIIDYQKERLANISKELVNFKASNAFDELDAELGNN